MSFAVGDIVGDYEIIEKLGAGGMGAVYKARHVISDRIEALKILLPDVSTATDVGDRFMREIKIQASLSHPNIAALHTAVRVDNRLLMVMEFIEGVSLDQKLRREGVDLFESVNYLEQTLSALSYAHGRGVVHRDIKPANIMITPSGTVKLLDFGIARGADSRKLTIGGATIGSLHYMSPEQIRTKSLDARSDIYSLGATFYEVLAGVCPFESESTYMIMTGHLEEEPKPPHLIHPNIPVGLSNLILKALQKNPDHRFQSAAEFLDALRALEETLPAHLTRSARPVVSEVPTRSMITPAVENKQSTAEREREGWDPKTLDAITKALAVYIGPIAKILVQRAAKQTHSMRALYDKLADEIASDADRTKFLASRPRD